MRIVIEGIREEITVTALCRREGIASNVIRVREEPLKTTSSTDISVPLRQDMKLTVNAVLLKIEQILGVRLTGLEHYLNAQHLQNSVASKKFARHLMKNNATQKDG
mgnify:CR=1 FL=1